MYFNEFEIDCLEAHNQYRAEHGSPPLVLDRGICNYAKEWAVVLARGNTFQHRSNNRYGENLYMSVGRANVSGNDPVTDWYAEIKDYDFLSDGEFSAGTGHFTQVVWKDSQRLGVAMAKSENRIYIVANYDPPGNYSGRFSKNVLPALY